MDLHVCLLRRREIDNGLLTLHQFRERLLIAMDTGVTKTASVYIISEFIALVVECLNHFEVYLINDKLVCELFRLILKFNEMSSPWLISPFV